MMTSDSEDESAASSTSIGEGVCNWCAFVGKLAKNKPYCESCRIKAFRECTRCRRPLPNENYFKTNPNRCNACEKKYQKELKGKRLHSDDEGKPKPPAKKARGKAAIRKAPAKTPRGKHTPIEDDLCQCEHAIRARFLKAQPAQLGFSDRKIGFIPVFI